MQLTSVFKVVGALLLLSVDVANAKLAFAHFMVFMFHAASSLLDSSLTNSRQVSNAANYTLADWTYDITLALQSHVYAFALNTAYDQGDEPQYELAFEAANTAGFTLFFSFDYAGNGAWPKESVLEILEEYASNDVYYHYNGQPFVSTFEGPDNAEDCMYTYSLTIHNHCCASFRSYEDQGLRSRPLLDATLSLIGRLLAQMRPLRMVKALRTGSSIGPHGHGVLRT